MFQCQINKLSGGIILSIIVVLLSSLCSYGITEYCNHLQIALLQLNDIPFSYRMLFKMSSGIAALVPLMIFMFLYFTSDMMLNTVFEEKVDRRSLLSIIGISYIPMLIYQYIFWYNLITYCAIGKLADAKDLLSVPFMYDLKLKDFEFINLVCWGLIYLIVILYLIFKDKNVFKVIGSILFPSMIVALTYYIISI